MNEPLLISASTEPRVSLRAAGPDDLEDLRVWKNANAGAFFFKGEITPGMQKDWYAGYLARPHDFMFIVEHAGRKVGCMAYRLLEKGGIDAYNMIAAPGAAGKGFMKAAMRLMCSYIAARHGRDIGCLVVKGNPALKYYERCGYRVAGEAEDHHILKLDWTAFKPVAFEEKR